MKFYTRRRVSPVITIVSLVDILTMVLMFFVYTTTFKTNQPMVTIVVPEVKSSNDKPTDQATTILSIDKTGNVFIGDKPVAVEELGGAVKEAQGRGQQLAMKADENAPFGKIMAVLDALKGAGVSNVPAFTRPK